MTSDLRGLLERLLTLAGEVEGESEGEEPLRRLPRPLNTSDIADDLCLLSELPMLGELPFLPATPTTMASSRPRPSLLLLLWSGELGLLLEAAKNGWQRIVKQELLVCSNRKVAWLKHNYTSLGSQNTHVNIKTKIVNIIIIQYRI